jgi:hypothetical protein
MEDARFLSRSFGTGSTPLLAAEIAFVVIHEILRLNNHDDMDRVERLYRNKILFRGTFTNTRSYA